MASFCRVVLVSALVDSSEDNSGHAYCIQQVDTVNYVTVCTLLFTGVTGSPFPVESTSHGPNNRVPCLAVLS